MKVIQYLMPSYFLSHALVHLGNWCYKASEWVQGDDTNGPWQTLTDEEFEKKMAEEIEKARRKGK